MKSFTALFLSAVLVTFLPSVSAHGFVSQVAIDGTLYKGNHPNNPKQASPIRLINDVSPVKGATNPHIVCGPGAQNGKTVASASPGSLMTFSWHSGDDSIPNWPHNTGPMITYMGNCNGQTADKCDATKVKWFKIHEVGKMANGSWVQSQIMNGHTLTVPIPGSLKAGDYLVRHEIVALHLANEQGGAEFYPSCTQVRISGDGTGVPQKTVAFPGAYKDTDPGILDVNVFDSGDKYVFPGPPVAKLVSSNSGSGSTATSTPKANNNAAQAPTVTSSDISPSASASTVPSKSCNMHVDAKDHQRRYSRIMRRLMH